MVSPAQSTLRNTKLNLRSAETIIVVVATAYHNTPALVYMAQVAGQSVLEEPHAAFLLVQYSKEESVVLGTDPAPCAGTVAQKPSACTHHLLFIIKKATVS